MNPLRPAPILTATPGALGYDRRMDDPSKGVPQFATAEFAPKPAPAACAACRRPLSGPYFTVNGLPACAECTRKLEAQIPRDSHVAFLRALLFGIAGAIAGFALYVLFALTTGLVVGFVSLAVGFIVGKAMNLGSGGVGGRRYQIVAVLLTYLAVSLSAVPIGIHQLRQHADQSQTAEGTQRPAAPIGKVIGVLALAGIASPFLDLQDPMHGLIGLVILFVGMRFAWRFTAGRRLEVSGPYSITPSPSAAI